MLQALLLHSQPVRAPGAQLVELILFLKLVSLNVHSGSSSSRSEKCCLLSNYLSNNQRKHHFSFLLWIVEKAINYWCIFHSQNTPCSYTFYSISLSKKLLLFRNESDAHVNHTSLLFSLLQHRLHFLPVRKLPL